MKTGYPVIVAVLEAAPTGEEPTKYPAGERFSRRAAIVNYCGAWRKLVPAFVGIEQPSSGQRGVSGAD